MFTCRDDNGSELSSQALKNSTFNQGTGQKLEGGGGGGWCKHGEGHGFSCKHKREGQTILCMSLRGGALFFMQRCWGQGVNLQFLCSHSHSPVNIIWNTFFI